MFYHYIKISLNKKKKAEYWYEKDNIGRRIMLYFNYDYESSFFKKKKRF